MASAVQKSALLLCGDYMEAYETIVPLYVLQSFGVSVHCVSPNRNAGDRCVMSAHDFLGLELYTELVVDQLTLNANFDDVTPENYDVIIIPGGRFTELLSADEKCVDLVARFAESKKLIFTSCHSQVMLMAAGILAGGVKCTAFESIKPLIELSGGEWWQQPGIQSMFEITDCVKDGNFMSTVGWPTLGHGIKLLLESLGGKVCSLEKKQASVLFLIGDYVEDYGINVPFRALQALGCKVDAVTPNKKKGEVCATAVYDLEDGRQIPAEKRGHNFFVTASWDDICVDDYDCVVVPGGRSPELLVMNEKAVALVKSFAEKDKVFAAIGQGKLLLAATGVLKGKRCASGEGMKVMVKVAGGEAVMEKGCVTDGKVVTAASATDLPAFLFDLSTALGLTVMF
ncbi:DJ-1 protein E [Arabidopsis thaliana]|uniref:YLS5 n=2 Tax=Arabidopsis TaxID=3701 RepID=A0A178W293_ARATH|nr:Class I glutamine amidotransferase-like [Arabidopsis thaliana x Arabidopsis arenosa]OAP11242.1 YLS5 [Arabidopsis thaliana]